MNKVCTIFLTLLLNSFSYSQASLLGSYSSVNNSVATIFTADKSNNAIFNSSVSDVSAEIINKYLKTSKELISSGVLTSSSNSLFIAKPTYTDYVVLPSGKNNPYLEFHDHEVTTLNGTTVGLSTISMSATFSNNLPATLSNGAVFSRQGVFREDVIGAGSTPWLSMVASGTLGGPSITLNSFANASPDNGTASFVINNGSGNIFRVGTNDNKSFFGYEQTANTSLTLSAETIYTAGKILSGSSIQSTQWLSVGSNSTNIRVSSLGITFTDNDASSYIGYSPLNNGINTGAFVIQSTSSNIVFNSVSLESSLPKSIGFAFDFHNVVKFTPTEIILLKPFTRQNLHDEEILAIESPREGQEVYSLDQHAPVFYNGKQWMIATGLKELPKRKLRETQTL